MANVNKVKVNNTIYDIEDTVARSSAVTMSSRADGSVSLSSASAGTSVNVPSLTNFGDPGLLEDDAVTEINTLKTDVSDLRSQIAQGGGGLTADVKQALMDVVNHVGWVGDDPTGQTYITALQTALYPPANLTSISCVYTQSGTVYTTDSLDSLKSDLVVTAHYSDSTTEVVTSYALSGTLTEGTSTITVAYGGKTTTFTVTVTEALFDGSMYVTVANETLAEGYINDQGGVSSASNNYYIDKFYEALPFALCSNGDFNGFGPSASARGAYYDANQGFLSRDYSTSGIIKEVSNSSAVYEKIGWTNMTLDYVFLLKEMDSALFTNANKNIDALGNLIDASGQIATDLIELPNADKCAIIPDVGNAVIRVAFYDSNQGFISRVFNSGGTHSGKTPISDIPTNAKYFRVDKPTNGTIYHPIAKGI